MKSEMGANMMGNTGRLTHAVPTEIAVLTDRCFIATLASIRFDWGQYRISAKRTSAKFRSWPTCAFGSIERQQPAELR